MDATPAVQKRAQTRRVRRLAKLIRIGQANLVSDVDVAVFAGRGAWTWATSGNECLATGKLEPKAIPGNRSPNWTFGDPALSRAKTVVHDIDKRGLPGLGPSSDDAYLARLQRQRPAPSVMAKQDDIQDLYRHGRTPSTARTVDSLPVSANHFPTNSALLAHSRTSALVPARDRVTGRLHTSPARSLMSAISSKPLAVPNKIASFV
jgi:hypothetical protein